MIRGQLREAAPFFIFILELQTAAWYLSTNKITYHIEPTAQNWVIKADHSV